MKIQEQISINGSRVDVWKVITDLESAAETISGIESVEILERPSEGIVGLKWREERVLFGKSSTEEMWITEAVENEFYEARAESHGCIYRSAMNLQETDKGAVLKMSHISEPQTPMAKMMGPLMSLMCKGAVRKLILQDLQDIKAKVERETDPKRYSHTSTPPPA